MFFSKFQCASQQLILVADVGCNVNRLTPELNPSAQSCLPRFFTGVLIFKGLAARLLYKSFAFKGLIT
jgi:hypothetical protein